MSDAPAYKILGIVSVDQPRNLPEVKRFRNLIDGVSDDFEFFSPEFSLRRSTALTPVSRFNAAGRTGVEDCCEAT